MTTKQLIATLQKLDPTGNMKIVHADFENGDSEPVLTVKQADYNLRDTEVVKGETYIEIYS